MLRERETPERTFPKDWAVLGLPPIPIPGDVQGLVLPGGWADPQLGTGCAPPSGLGTLKLQLLLNGRNPRC